MSYQELTLPPALAPQELALIRNQLEPQLRDVHAMLRLPIEQDPGLQGRCNLSVAQVLLSVVSGVSVTFYDPSALNRRGDRGNLFKELLAAEHYPWAQEEHISCALLCNDAAAALYEPFRNPLVHTLGLIDAQDNPSGRRVVVEKGSFREEVIEDTEKATSRPVDWESPTLREDGQVLILWVRSFYWGVRMMIQNIANTRAEPQGQSTYVLPANLSGRAT